VNNEDWLRSVAKQQATFAAIAKSVAPAIARHHAMYASLAPAIARQQRLAEEVTKTLAPAIARQQRLAEEVMKSFAPAIAAQRTIGADYMKLVVPAIAAAATTPELVPTLSAAASQQDATDPPPSTWSRADRFVFQAYVYVLTAICLTYLKVSTFPVDIVLSDAIDSSDLGPLTAAWLAGYVYDWLHGRR
jgi:hypothetical protein